MGMFGGKFRAPFPRNSATVLPRTKTSLSLWIKICTQRKMGRRKRAKWRFACLLRPSHGPLRFVTSHSRFALASMRNTKRLRRRQVTDHEKGDRPPQNSSIMQCNIHLILREKWRFFFPILLVSSEIMSLKFL